MHTKMLHTSPRSLQPCTMYVSVLVSSSDVLIDLRVK